MTGQHGGIAGIGMTSARTRDRLVQRLRDHGIRPTRQRLALADLLFSRGDRHVSAEGLHAEVLEQRGEPKNFTSLLRCACLKFIEMSTDRHTLPMAAE